LKGGRVTVINEDVLNVWDVNAEGWRSFRMDNITKVQL
jgi:predicted DNA-binding transcriptional regulator YafY